jgi:NADH dehydrogenase
VIAEPRTICVLGGTGFVGRHLSARWTQLGHTLRVPTRSRARHRDLLVLPRVSLVEGYVHAAQDLRALFEGCDTVVNLVGILNERGRDGRGFRHAHVELAQKVVDACGALGIRRLLHMSALGADATRAPSHYLRSKGEAEAIVRNAPGIAATIFRPSTIFGPDDSFLNRFARLLRLPSPLFPLPRADSRFAPVYIGDVVAAYTRALHDPHTAGESYELCGPRVWTLREIVDGIAQALSLRRRIVPVPDSLARVQARLMEFLPGKPFSKDNFLSLTVDSVCARDGLAQLEIRPTALEVSLRRLADDPQERYDRFRRVASRR